ARYRRARHGVGRRILDRNPRRGCGEDSNRWEGAGLHQGKVLGMPAGISDHAARRVVVTGLGLVTPLGTGVEKTWKAICAGQSGIGRITKFDSTGYDAQIAGEVKDFDPAQFIEKKDIKKMDAFIHYAVGAAQLAADDAGLKVA